MKVFVSYNHKQSDWARNRLVPCLEAGGAEVLVDWRQFSAGRTVLGQMDATRIRPTSMFCCCLTTI